MKKLSVLLLILTLVNLMPANVVSALEAGEEQSMTTGVEQGATTELPVMHELDQRMHIQAIKPREGLVDIEVTSPIGEQLQAQRIWLATFDYESGWTEEEADGMLDDWTTLETDWTKATKEQLFTDALSHFYATMALTVEGTRLQYDLTVMNLPDVLYYAVEFKDLMNEDAETFWLRGKVDYRGCAHAQRFREGQTGTCAEMVDWNAGTVKYWAEESTEDEEVVTWEEEWRLVLAGRISAVGVVLDGLAMVPDLPKESLAQGLAYEEEKLTKIEALLAKATGVEEEIVEVGRLRERMAKMLNDSSEGVEDGSSNGSGSGTSSDDGSGVDSEIIGDDGDLSSGAGFGSNGNLDSNPDFIENVVSDLGSPDFGDLVFSNNSNTANDHEETVNRTVGDEEGSNEDLGLANGAKATEADVEVSKLGGAKVDMGGWIWWTMGLSGAAALFIVVVLNRKQRK